MNKYELAVVVNAKIEDDARAQVIEKVKEVVARFGGNVTDVDEWGKRRFISKLKAQLRLRLNRECVLWIMSSDFCA